MKCDFVQWHNSLSNNSFDQVDESGHVYRILFCQCGLNSFSPLGDINNDTVLSISTDVRRRASATSIRDVSYFFPKLE